MKLIIGLGNPGSKCEHTRHNAGFLAVDYFLRDKQVISCQSKFKAEICELHEGATKIFVVKPQTFMNLSGSAIRELCDFYKLDATQDLLVIHDEKDLPFGTIRYATDSSSAGHNGVQSIIDALGTKQFKRIRIGVESREPGSPIPTDVFVLQNFSPEELETLNKELLPEVYKHMQEFLQN